jgi:hypothetical protein
LLFKSFCFHNRCIYIFCALCQAPDL